MQMSFFPSRTIALYVAKLFLVRTLAVLAALVLVLQALDLLGESGKILAYPSNGDAQLWYYVSLRAPQIIARFLPFSVLLGTLITLATLNQNSEVISMKAAGLSAHQVLAPLIVASLGVAALSFTFNERLVTRATATLAQWQDVDYGPVPKQRPAQTNVWVREGGLLIRVAEVHGRGTGTVLKGVTIYDRTTGALDHILSAPEARYAPGGGWALSSGTSFNVSRGVETPMGPVTVGREIRPDQFTLADVDGDSLSYWELGAAIGDLKGAGRQTAALEASMLHKISGPLSSVLMPLLGAVAAFGLARSGRLFIRAVIGMALGFTYFVADNFALAMGNLSAYPPILAAWAPFVLFLLIGEAVLVRTEE